MSRLIPALSAILVCALFPLASLASQPAATMHAVRMHDFGPAEVLVYEEAPRPTAGAGEALIRVRAAGVNPVDWKIRSGAIRAWAPTLPYIPGFDVAGVVESVGEGVTTIKPGDEVYAFISVQRAGGYAEYVAVPTEWIAPKPATIDFVQAAAVPLAGLTAWQALFDKADLQPGQTVLIHGGAGGVGHFAVQLAHAKGAKVIATASKRNHEFLQAMGADEVIDYQAAKFEEIVRDVDVVLDTIGGDTQERSFGVLKPGGIIVSIVQPPDPAKLAAHKIRGVVMLVQPNAQELAELGAMIDAGKVKPEVSEVLLLRDAAKAHAMSETGHTRGKIVLSVR